MVRLSLVYACHIPNAVVYVGVCKSDTIFNLYSLVTKCSQARYILLPRYITSTTQVICLILIKDKVIPIIYRKRDEPELYPNIADIIIKIQPDVKRPLINIQETATLINQDAQLTDKIVESLKTKPLHKLIYHITDY